MTVTDITRFGATPRCRTARRSSAARRLGVVVVAASIVSACAGSDADDTDDADDAASQAAVAEATAESSGEANAEPTTEPTTEATADPTAEEPATDDAVDDGDDDESSGTRMVELSFGSVEVPIAPSNVLVLDGYTTMTMLAVGVEPARYADPNQGTIVRSVIERSGVPLIEVGNGFEFNYEAIAAEQPDLVLLTATDGFESLITPIRDIAPTVVLPFRASWRDHVADVAAIFDRSAAAADVVMALDAEIDAVAGVVPDSFQLSVLGQTLGLLFALAQDATASQLAAAVGIDRPEAQLADGNLQGQPLITLSEEVLQAHDADFVAVYAGNFYDDELLADLPTFVGLEAVADDRWATIDGDMWTGIHPFAVYWVLQDLRGIATDGSSGVGTIDDAADRFEAFRAASGT